MLYVTRLFSTKMAAISITTLNAVGSTNEAPAEDDIYRNARSAPLQSFQDELLTSLKRAHRLSKLDPTYMNRLRNVWLWQLANGRCQTGINFETCDQLCKVFLCDSSVHPLYATLCCCLVRNVHPTCAVEDEAQYNPNITKPVYLWRLLSNFFGQSSSGTQYLSKPITTSSSVSLTPLMLSPVYNGLLTRKMCFSQDVLDGFVDNIQSLLLEASIHYQSLSGGLFSGSKKQPLVVKELDGSQSQDCFTLLSSAPLYSGDQLLNIHSFSIMKRLLSPPIDGVFSSILANREALDSIRKYCLRLLEQCERKPVVAVRDAILLEAVFSESLSVLSILCVRNEQIGHSVFHTARTLCFSILNDEELQNVSLFALDFLLNYGDSEMFNMDYTVVDAYRKVICHSLQSQCLAYDVVDFTLRNKTKLTLPVNYIEKFFPSLLKIVAWYPLSFLNEVVKLLPLFTTVKTAAEVFHALIDLPCTAAVLELSRLANSSLNESSPYKECLTFLEDVKFQIIYDFFLRDDSGRGDTVDFLSQFQTVLAPFSDHPRIKTLSQIIPMYLESFFNIVLPLSTPEVASSLITGMLERALVLYGPPEYTSVIRSTMASKLILLVESHPTVVVSNQSEIVDFVMVYQNYVNTGDFYTNLVWTLGEYSSYVTMNHTSMSNDIHMKYHECLETVAYEAALLASEDTFQVISSKGWIYRLYVSTCSWRINTVLFLKTIISHSDHATLQLNETTQYFVKVLLVLMGSLAKIATLCQELIPRVLLCLNKVVQQIVDSNCEKDSAIVLLRRASELINVLKMPNVAVAVLAGHHVSSSSPSDKDAQKLDTVTFLIDRSSRLAKI